MNMTKSLFVCMFVICGAKAPDQGAAERDVKELYEQVHYRSNMKMKNSGTFLDGGIEYAYTEVSRDGFSFRITAPTVKLSIRIFCRIETKDSSKFYSIEIFDDGLKGIPCSGSFPCQQSPNKMVEMGVCLDGGKPCCRANYESWKVRYRWAVRECLTAFKEGSPHGKNPLALVSK